MDTGTVEPPIQKHFGSWPIPIKSNQQCANALPDELAPRHVYFQQFCLDLRSRISRAVMLQQYTEDILPRKCLYDLPGMLRQTQSQIRDFSPAVLDMDNRTEAVSQRMAAHYKSAGEKSFRFYPQPIISELVNDAFTEVLAPNSICISSASISASASSGR